MTAPTADRLALTVPEAARRLGLSRSAAYAAVASGDLPAKRIGHRWVVPVALLEAFINQPDNQPKPAAPALRRIS